MDLVIDAIVNNAGADSIGCSIGSGCSDGFVSGCYDYLCKAILMVSEVDTPITCAGADSIALVLR
jgi:hypothetical protein